MAYSSRAGKGKPRPPEETNGDELCDWLLKQFRTSEFGLVNLHHFSIDLSSHFDQASEIILKSLKAGGLLWVLLQHVDCQQSDPCGALCTELTDGCVDANADN